MYETIVFSFYGICRARYASRGTISTFYWIIQQSSVLIAHLLPHMYSRPEIHSGDRHGVAPLAPVTLRLGSAPTHGTTLLNAAKLGLEVENDVRLAGERLKTLRQGSVPRHVRLDPIVDHPVRYADSDIENSDDDEDINSMPLL